MRKGYVEDKEFAEDIVREISEQTDSDYDCSAYAALAVLEMLSDRFDRNAEASKRIGSNPVRWATGAAALNDLAKHVREL